MKIFKKILALLFPQKCLGCQKENEILCPECLLKISRPDTPYLKGVHIAANYQDQTLKKALWLLKYKGVKQLAKPLAELIKERVWEKIKKENWLIVPIPLSPKKLRKRGFNQAELVARHLFNSEPACPADEPACRRGRNNLLWGGGVLSKIKETKSQVEVKDKKERLANIIGSFKAEKPELVKGRKIILIDDVRTTGATMSEAKKILISAGAKKVEGVVVARG